jgi:hypothetical protein
VGGKAKRWEERRRGGRTGEKGGGKANRWEERQRGTTYEAIVSGVLKKREEEKQIGSGTRRNI